MIKGYLILIIMMMITSLFNSKIINKLLYFCIQKKYIYQFFCYNDTSNLLINIYARQNYK